MMTLKFIVFSAIQGHHVYKDIWVNPVIEELKCQREIRNSHDPLAVGVCKWMDMTQLLDMFLAEYLPHAMLLFGTVSFSVL